MKRPIAVFFFSIFIMFSGALTYLYNKGEFYVADKEEYSRNLASVQILATMALDAPKDRLETICGIPYANAPKVLVQDKKTYYPDMFKTYSILEQEVFKEGKKESFFFGIINKETEKVKYVYISAEEGNLKSIRVFNEEIT